MANLSKEVNVTVTPAAEGNRFIYGKKCLDIFITDPGLPRTSGLVEQGTGANAAVELLPLSIIMSTSHPHHTVERLILSPERTDDSSPRASPSTPSHPYSYRFSSASAIQSASAPANSCYRLLAGSLRSLVYTTPQDSISDLPSITGLYKYHDKYILDGGSADLARMAVHEVPVDFHEDSRISAMAWDDTIGRAYFANEVQGCVKVVDFAHVPVQGLSTESDGLQGN